MYLQVEIEHYLIIHTDVFHTRAKLFKNYTQNDHFCINFCMNVDFFFLGGGPLCEHRFFPQIRFKNKINVLSCLKVRL